MSNWLDVPCSWVPLFCTMQYYSTLFLVFFSRLNSCWCPHGDLTCKPNIWPAGYMMFSLTNINRALPRIWLYPLKQWAVKSTCSWRGSPPFTLAANMDANRQTVREMRGNLIAWIPRPARKKPTNPQFPSKLCLEKAGLGQLENVERQVDSIQCLFPGSFKHWCFGLLVLIALSSKTAALQGSTVLWKIWFHEVHNISILVKWIFRLTPPPMRRKLRPKGILMIKQLKRLFQEFHHISAQFCHHLEFFRKLVLFFQSFWLK